MLLPREGGRGFGEGGANRWLMCSDPLRDQRVWGRAEVWGAVEGGTLRRERERFQNTCVSDKMLQEKVLEGQFSQTQTVCGVCSNRLEMRFWPRGTHTVPEREPRRAPPVLGVGVMGWD